MNKYSATRHELRCKGPQASGKRKGKQVEEEDEEEEEEDGWGGDNTDDDEEEYEEDEDGRPSWFDEDDQDDGIKGQDIVEPDYDDLSTIIRIDEARIPWSIPREE